MKLVEIRGNNTAGQQTPTEKFITVKKKLDDCCHTEYADNKNFITTNVINSKKVVKQFTKRKIAKFASYMMCIVGMELLVTAVVLLLISHNSWYISTFIGLLCSGITVLLIATILHFYAVITYTYGMPTK